MASLDEEMAVLKAEIEGYELKLNDATSSEDIRIWAGLIKSCRENLTELEKRRNAQAAVVDAELAVAHPSVLECGRSEYATTVDQWLSDFASTLGLTSESGVVATDFLWQGILGKLCNLTVLLNQKDASSQVKLRPDFTGLFNNIFVIKGEAKTDSSEIPTAISELIDKFHATAHLMFPSLCPIIPGIASSRQIISLHRIYYD
eukprot:gene15919-21597_t